MTAAVVAALLALAPPLPAGAQLEQTLDLRGVGRVVVWHRGLQQHGIDVWRRRRRVFAMRPRAQSDSAFVRARDVVGDRRQELLVQLESGTGACGPKRLLRFDTPRPRTIFFSNGCDTMLTLAHGAVVSSSGVYALHDAHCCPTFSSVTTYRWRGGRFVPTRRALYWNCIDKVCEHWRRGPLRFAPRLRAFWDARRGVAVGNARPWLIGRTANGGRSWQIVDASICPLGPPRLRPRGRGTIAFLHCKQNRRARTTNYGAGWVGD